MLDDQLDALERTINEILALNVIYNDADINGTERSTSFITLSKDEFQEAQTLIENNPSSAVHDIPILRVEIILSVDVQDEIHQAKIDFTLPPGYPEILPATASVVSIGNLNRTKRDEFVKVLNNKATEMIGSEALMELIQDAEETAIDFLSCSFPQTNIDDSEKEKPSSLSRRWIWVHHITNANRCKDIAQEAQERSLGGYLKSGYPGIVVVEGDSDSCDLFVQWIKGNKSRPGGFGRNWGHHVRGELTFQDNRVFTNDFEDVGEDLAVFASLCRDVGMEDEFKLYIMQH